MKISFLASHGGTVARAVISAIHRGELAAQVGIIVTNNRDSLIYQWSCENQVPVQHISGATHPEDAARDRAILCALQGASTNLILLSGYMKKIGPLTLHAFHNRILNVHPSLLPKYGGVGYYGDKVYRAVLASGDTQSGVSVHIVNQDYDEGPIVCQKEIQIAEGETLKSLKRKTQQLESELCIEAIQHFIALQ